MKREEVVKAESELKVVTGWHYARGSICSLDSILEPSFAEKRQEVRERIAGKRCPRCGGDLEKDTSGRIVCVGTPEGPMCGLVLSDELKKKYGY